MVLLSEADRAAAWAAYMSDRSSVRDDLGINKPELRAAINAVDDWINTNAPSFNAALPVAARTALSGAQKAQLLLFVVRRRWEVS